LYTIEEIKLILKSMLSKKRYIHSLNVADESVKLAERWGGENEKKKAYLAGLVHDACKDMPQDEQKLLVEKSSGVCNVELETPALWHSVAGAWYVKNRFYIDDDDIINAVRYHTSARAGMSRLEEIIYMADLISADRSYSDVEKVRKLAYSSLEKAMLYALKFSIIEVAGKGSKIPINTIEAYNQYTSAGKI